MNPFADADGGYELYERIDAFGRVYIAVKSGFLLLGIISPYDLINEEFVNTLKSLLDLSRVALSNKAHQAIIENSKQLTLDDEEDGDE